MEVGDIYECVLEDGSDGRRFNNPLAYDAVFRSIGGAIHHIRTCNFPAPVIHRLVFVAKDKWDFHIYDMSNERDLAICPVEAKRR